MKVTLNHESEIENIQYYFSDRRGDRIALGDGNIGSKDTNHHSIDIGNS